MFTEVSKGSTMSTVFGTMYVVVVFVLTDVDFAAALASNIVLSIGGCTLFV